MLGIKVTPHCISFMKGISIWYWFKDKPKNAEGGGGDGGGKIVAHVTKLIDFLFSELLENPADPADTDPYGPLRTPDV